MVATWTDIWTTPVTLQTSNSLPYPTSIDVTAKAFGVAPTLQTKQFISEGIEAFYTF